MAENSGYVNDETQVTSFTNEKNTNGTEKKKDNAYENDEVGSGTDVQVDISEQNHTGPYAGMPKEVLLKYSRQKRFLWARHILTGMVILIIFILLALVITIIAISPPCLQFWQTSPIYHIYPKSFRSADDSNGNGDFKGIIEKLDYVQTDLGINFIAVSSVYESPQFDNGYDVSDFKNVDSIFGTMKDMESFIVEVHDRGMKIVVDFIPNHSSDMHEWFLASSNTTHPQHEKYKDYYVWVNGSSETDVPNNWRSEYGNESAWTWNEQRQQFYYHSFSSKQPDLNLRSEDVRNELKDILRFWLEKGIDGFRCLGVEYLFEAEHLRDNPVIDVTKPMSRENLYPDYTQNYKGSHDLVADWRELLDQYSTEPGVYRFLETQFEGDDSTSIRYYGTEQTREADFPMNSQFLKTSGKEWNGNNIRNKIMKWMSAMPEGKWPNWVLSNPESSRVASRTDVEITRCIGMMYMTLPGTAAVYYGDEIGMTDITLASSTEDRRNAARSPMQWTSGDNAGFCKNCTSWLPINDNYMNGINVENQTSQSLSLLAMYKKLISLRSDIIFQRGYFCMLQTNTDVLVYVRELSGLTSMMILVNFGDTSVGEINLASLYSNLPSSGQVELYTSDIDNFKVGNTVSFENLNLPAKSAVIVSYNEHFMFNERSDMVGSCFINSKVCYNTALQVVQTC
uniref:neutral and basic amino acid transport protein rBAT-like n=1 Tax=Styela clava TaxID=7725 RepID=UPI001939550F|nr:neutral and basic amino acid transport protein rBAT-like [Styela clava]